MSDQDPQLVFLEELVQERATIAGDVVEIDAHTWAIHGSIAVDGENAHGREHGAAFMVRSCLQVCTGR